MAAADQLPEPLKYQTLSLKVSIHCEGCKRKVKKVLQNIEGVYKVSIEPQLHKVVVTGNVDAETLIKKLLKTGKHAEHWPEKKPENNNNSSNNNNGSGSGSKKKNKNKNANKANEPSDTNQSSASEENSSTEVSEQKPEPEVPHTPSKDPTPPPEKQEVVEKLAVSPPAGNGGGGKKKNKKGNNNNNNSKSGGGNGNGNGSGGVDTETNPQHEADAVKKVTGENVAIPPSYNNFPGTYGSYNLPSYVVSYNSVQPSMSYGGACYMASPLHQSSSYVNSATPGSYYIFSDENANACMIM